MKFALIHIMPVVSDGGKTERLYTVQEQGKSDAEAYMVTVRYRPEAALESERYTILEDAANLENWSDEMRDAVLDPIRRVVEK